MSLSVSLLSFVCGLSVMAAEISALRLVSPFFGTSTPVWATLIAFVLGGLALGAHVGGTLADRIGEIRPLRVALCVCGAWLAILPFVGRSLLAPASHWLLSGRPLLGGLAVLLTMILAFPPVVALGSVGPYLVRISALQHEMLGRISGKLSAASTLGSIVGTLLAAFAGLPLLGTARTLIACGVLLAFFASASLAWRWRIVALAIPISAWFAAPMSQYRHPRALSALDTPYAFVQVVEQKDGARLLLFNEGFAHQSVYRPGKPVRDEVFAQMALVPAMSRSPEAPRVLILGLGAGTMARAILDAWPRAHVVGVELDGQVLELARRYFDLPTKIETHRADARAWLRGEGRTFDAILVDCFRFPYIPFYLTTLEFFAELRERITDGGVIAVNVGRYRDEKALVEAIGLSLSSTFTEVVSLDASNSSNTLLFAGEPGLVQRLTRNAAALPTPARQIAAVLAHDLRPLERKAHEVFTDDRAPVEFLTDAILLSSLWRFRGKL